MDEQSDIPVVEIKSVSDLASRVAEIYTGNDAVIFRGQRLESWKLVPRLGRLNLRAKYSGSILEAERKMLADFERLSVARLDGRSIQDNWDRLALAQHHGLPTRLLDWTSNPLVALWFAVERPPEKKERAVVWAYESVEDDYVDMGSSPFEGERTMIFRPRHHDSRIAAQVGWFSVHKYLESAMSFSTFERTGVRRTSLRKFVVPHGVFPSIREDLARYGVTRASLFPDLAGLCEFIEWKYTKLSDEEDHDILSIL